MRSFRLHDTQLPPRHLLFQECPVLGVQSCLICSQNSKLLVSWLLRCLEYAGRVLLSNSPSPSNGTIYNLKKGDHLIWFQVIIFETVLIPQMCPIMCISKDFKMSWEGRDQRGETQAEGDIECHLRGYAICCPFSVWTRSFQLLRLPSKSRVVTSTKYQIHLSTLGLCCARRAFKMRLLLPLWNTPPSSS